ncbi:hypothetical protein PPGU19_005750 [Paraburkholderia sp. PGU19]|nr:hypothetical protein PPGU19_005750 [Paraburkholderia sp. PGU19]
MSGGTVLVPYVSSGPVTSGSSDRFDGCAMIAGGTASVTDNNAARNRFRRIADDGEIESGVRCRKEWVLFLIVPGDVGASASYQRMDGGLPTVRHPHALCVIVILRRSAPGCPAVLTLL